MVWSFPRDAWSRRLPYFVWSIPVVLSVISQCFGPTLHAMSAPTNLPTLSFHQYLIDYGEVAAKEEVATLFKFVNVGSDVVHIDRLEPSCGCLQPQLRAESKELDPNEKGEFAIRIQTANQAIGPKEYSITVHYRDPEPKTTVVRFRVVLPDNQVTVRPNALVVYTEDNNPLIQTAEVVDRRPRKLGITQISVEPENLAIAEPQGEFDDQNGFRHYKLRISINPELANGSHRGVVWIQTEDPAYKRVRIPIGIHKGKQAKRSKLSLDRSRRPSSERRAE